VLADSGVGAAPTGGLPHPIGRAVQLGYEQQAAATVAISLQAFIAEHRLSAVSLSDLRAALLPAVQVADRDDLDDDDEYLRLEPQYRKYEAHLRAAALGGVRAAALEYGTAFENPEFIALAERLTGEVDALKLARHASSNEARERWLRTAAEQGSRTAIEALASQGDAWADDHWLRSAAQRALDAGNFVRAWSWQYLALERGVDLTRSTMPELAVLQWECAGHRARRRWPQEGVGGLRQARGPVH
jgi:hypothetical protein